MEKRYRALHIISTLYKVLGVIVLVIAILSGVGICLAGVLGGSALQSMGDQLGRGGAIVGLLSSALGGIIAGLFGMIGGGLTGLSLYAVGEGISLAIALEENTRATAAFLAAQKQ